MTDFAKYLLMVLAFLLGIIPGYFAGHYFGKKEGVVIENATQTVTAGKAAEKANKQREQIDAETRKMPDPALIGDMRANGWLRD